MQSRLYVRVCVRFVANLPLQRPRAANWQPGAPFEGQRGSRMYEVVIFVVLLLGLLLPLFYATAYGSWCYAISVGLCGVRCK